MRLTCMAALFMVLYTTVEGHGRLYHPPARGTMWRYGFDNIPNTSDHGLNCGGKSTQFGVNNGKCGICGDNYADPKPRANEYGGKYGKKGTIVATYKPGETIEVKSLLTANHLGSMQYRICRDRKYEKDLEQACFDENLLVGEDGLTTTFPISANDKDVTHKVKLPVGLTCDACVLQWKYSAGNNWGVGPDGKGCKGCGDQETFQGCADIAIIGDTGEGDNVEGGTDTPENDTPVTVPDEDEEVNDSDASGTCNYMAAVSQAMCHTLPKRRWSNRH